MSDGKTATEDNFSAAGGLDYSRTVAMTDVTELIAAARAGDTRAEEQLFSLLYNDLRVLAHSRLRRSKPCTLLDTTALVHEAYLKLHQARYVSVADRAHFLAYAGRAMRCIIVDFIRDQGSLQREDRDANALPNPPQQQQHEILRIDQALRELANLNARLVQVVEMRYFAGMTETEVAEALSLTERTVRRDWEKARRVLAATLK
jgi:RNA polymerase sigma factor (TIGR02999 family)